MIIILHLLLLLTALTSSHALPPQLAQTPFINLDVDRTREKVPGDNAAYYTRERKAMQLFKIADFTMSPNPVIVNHRLFFFLQGTIFAPDLPGLSNATLSLYLRHQRWEDSHSSPTLDTNYTFTHTISGFKGFSVRKVPEFEYGGPLVSGRNEMVGDVPLVTFGPGGGFCVEDVEAVATLPDGRVLFAFEMKVSYRV